MDRIGISLLSILMGMLTDAWHANQAFILGKPIMRPTGISDV